MFLAQAGVACNLFPLLLILLQLTTGTDGTACHGEGEYCLMPGGSVVLEINYFTTEAQCTEACFETYNGNCLVYNWFGAHGKPYQNVCFLLNSCTGTIPGDDTKYVFNTNTFPQYCTCGVPYEGGITSNNLISVVYDCPDDLNCRLEIKCSVHCGYSQI